MIAQRTAFEAAHSAVVALTTLVLSAVVLSAVVLSAVVLSAVVLSAVALSARPAAAAGDQPVVYRIYLTHDHMVARSATRSIEYGLRSALIDVDPTSLIPGREVDFELVVRNHRANIYQAKRFYTEFVNDDRALLNMAGVHSPPLIKYRNYLHDNEGLTLVPWAAGTPVTQTDRPKNWIFRLSVDDRKAGAKIAQYAVQVRRCEAVHLLLTENAWGRSNAIALRAGFGRYGRQASSLQWIPWRADAPVIRRLVGVLEATPRDCVIFVGSTPQGVHLANALLDLPEARRPNLLSHWGLANDAFAEAVPFDARERVGLRFIQSCHNLRGDAPEVELALDRLRRTAGGAPWATASIPAAPGFAHAYDLGLILIEAMRQADLSGDARTDRAAVRAALESLRTPIRGLVKTYFEPFAPYRPAAPDAHEALRENDLCMARFAEDDTIEPDLSRQRRARVQ